MKIDDITEEITDGIFGISKKKLIEITQLYSDRKLAEDLEELTLLGGVNSFEQKLKTNFQKGLDDNEEDKQLRNKAYDSNKRELGEKKTFCALC